MKALCLLLTLFLPALQAEVLPVAVTVTGELRKWHRVTLRCLGPATTETATPNPFLDLRCDAVFTHPASGKSYTVPGYYAADGDAAETSAAAGNVWHVHFAPDEIGNWTYSLSFRAGAAVAVDPMPGAGESAGHFDGQGGTFEILPTDKSGLDFRGKGRLQYVGKHHLRFAESGNYFMKCGTDSPENLLAYDDFDATPDIGNLRKDWNHHQQHYDPASADAYTWQSGKGSELLGAIRYLSSQGLNSMSFLTFSLDGDDDNVFPHLINDAVPFGTSRSNTRWDAGAVHHDRFDVSKLAQWERILAYATSQGLYLHFKTQEVENDNFMNDPVDGIGPERNLYYRELVARFGHHLALNWNLGEENSNSNNQREAFAQWFHDHDPYRHNVVLHTRNGQKNSVYGAMLAAEAKLTGASVRTAYSAVNKDTEEWVRRSTNSGRPWVVACDEPGDASVGVHPDSVAANNQAVARQQTLWGNPLAGGAGVEWYFGYNFEHSDTTCEDFASRAGFWPYCRHMLSFWDLSGAPFWEMANQNALTANTADFCLAQAGHAYVIYLPSGASTTLDLTAAAGDYTVHWYDPRNGGALQEGSVTTVSGGGSPHLGTAPSDATQDWVILVRLVVPNTPPLRITYSGGVTILRFQGIPNVPYVVQRSPDLLNWAPVHTALADEAGFLDYTDTAPPKPNAFYRIKKP